MKKIILYIVISSIGLFANAENKTSEKTITNIKRARAYFAKGKFENALKFYQKVPKSSDYWLESIEEQAWTYTRMGETRKALAKTKTLLAKVFDPQIGSEPYLLAGYLNLKTCNYSEVFKVISKFKKRFKQKVAELNLISKNKMTPTLQLAIDTYSTKDFHWSKMKSNIRYLPRMFDKDKSLAKLFKTRKELLKQGLDAAHNTNKIKARFAVLAKSEIKEISKNIRRLNIVEAESIQRLHNINKVVKAPKIAKVNAKNVLTFPGDKEIWLDEIDKYRASHGNCPGLGESKL